MGFSNGASLLLSLKSNGCGETEEVNCVGLNGRKGGITDGEIISNSRSLPLSRLTCEHAACGSAHTCRSTHLADVENPNVALALNRSSKLEVKAVEKGGKKEM